MDNSSRYLPAHLTRTASVTGRPPPHDLDAEQAVIGGALLDPRLLVHAKVAAEDFYSRAHGTTWKAVLAVNASSQPVDAVSVATWMKDRNLVDEVGGIPGILSMLETPGGVSEAAFEGYQATILRLSSARRVLQRLQLAVAEVYEGVPDLTAWRSTLANEIASEGVDVGGAAMSYEDALKRLAARFWVKRDRVLTGLTALDAQIGGFFEGDLTVIAARPGMGKTSFAWQLVHAVASQGYRGAFLSCEQPPEEIFGRALSGEAEVPFSVVRSGGLTEYDKGKLIHASQRIREDMKRISVFDLTQPSVDFMRSLLMREKARVERDGEKLGIVVIDYLQIMKMLNPADRNGSVGHITATLKATAKELKLPIVLLSQLNRAVESRTDKRPNMADLRDSGSIEQDADNIMFLYRDGYYERNRTPQGPAEIDVAKQRNGEAGCVYVHWNGPRTRFEDSPS